MTSKICPQCNNQFKTKHNKQIFCSNKCRAQSKSTIKDYNCVLCNKIVKRTISNIGDNVYCSQKCCKEHQKKETITKQCSTCGKDVTRQNYKFKSDIVYCSSECSIKNLSQFCKVCGVEFCSIQYRKANNEKGFTIVRPKRHTCSDKCLIQNIKTNEERKEKISKAFSGENHPNFVNGYSKNHRIRKTDKKENFSNRDKKELLLKFNNKCFKCGSTERLTIDHNIPFVLGGRLTFSNSVVLCLSCNSRKNAKLPKDFYTTKEISKLEKMGIVSDSLFNYQY